MEKHLEYSDILESFSYNRARVNGDGTVNEVPVIGIRQTNVNYL